jgi:hypothetical protein
MTRAVAVQEPPVALYYFHLCDGCDTLIDPDGRELGEPDLIAGAALRKRGR